MLSKIAPWIKSNLTVKAARPLPVMLNWQIASAMLARMTLSYALHVRLNKCCGSVLVDGRE